LILVPISLSIMNFRCSKEILEPEPPEQAFQIPVSIYPLKKSYSLTDTIWIETDSQTKLIFDTRSNQNILADTGKISFGAVFNRFGASITNPPNGFCDIISLNGVNINRQLSQWGTGFLFDGYGCGQSNYRCKIGFKPNQKGTYFLSLFEEQFMGSCNNKIVPYYALVSYKYKNVDLNLDIFNSLSNNDKGGSDGIKFYTDKINNREFCIFRVD
jgi:hypothetical protein